MSFPGREQGVMECTHIGTLVEARGAGTVCTECGLVVSSLMEEGCTGPLYAAASEVNLSRPKLSKKDLDFLSVACERLGLPSDEYYAQVSNFFAERAPRVYERNKRAYLAALIVVVSRAMHHPRVGKEVALALGLRNQDVHRELRGIDRVMLESESYDVGVARSSDIVPRIMTALFLEGPTPMPMCDRRRFIARARSTADAIEDAATLNGRTPSTIAGVAIYLTGLTRESKRWRKVQIARAAHVTPSTLSKAIVAYGHNLRASAEPELKEEPARPADDIPPGASGVLEPKSD